MTITIFTLIVRYIIYFIIQDGKEASNGKKQSSSMDTNNMNTKLYVSLLECQGDINKFYTI